MKFDISGYKIINEPIENKTAKIAAKIASDGEIKIIINSLSNDVPKDLISTNIRQALFHLGNITGEISNDDVLANIFSKFCIGK